MNAQALTGSIVALVTPMTADGAVDYSALVQLCQWHLNSGTDGIAVCGTTGEAPLLSFDEYQKVVATTAETVQGRIPVIAGVGAPSTASCLKYSQLARAEGVDALLCVTPYYLKPNQTGLVAHYSALADADATPIVLYNVPSRTGVDLLPTTVRLLAERDNIVAIKEATGDLDRLGELLAILDDKIMCLSGDDATACEFILRGGRGVISVTANIVPEQMSELCAAAMAGERTKAVSINSRLSALHESLFVEPNPIPVKWLLAKMNKMQDAVRLPLQTLNKDNESLLLQAFERVGEQ